LARTIASDYQLKNVPKLEARVGTKQLLALNDIIIHNANSRHAIRYHLSLDGQALSPNEIIGDGVVIATPLGSTGYYRSITDSYFELGLGIAFNNSTEQSDHLVVTPDRRISVTISRGPAEVYADNQTEEIKLTTGETVIISQAEVSAKILSF
jgi:NAD kinase